MQRIAELEAKRAEYEQWLKLREDFLKKAEDNVVEIYSRMNPEAAAQQIASMADDTAAAVLAKLRVRNASTILNEMEPARGAHIANIAGWNASCRRREYQEMKFMRLLHGFVACLALERLREPHLRAQSGAGDVADRLWPAGGRASYSRGAARPV